jgi:predicted NodU family carbamoyl transferase
VYDNVTQVSKLADEDALVALTAAAVAEGQVVAWWHGRSEAGPRALGHRY